jgi:RNA polymerase sigma factor (sigma-70 family)
MIALISLCSGDLHATLATACRCNRVSPSNALRRKEAHGAEARADEHSLGFLYETQAERLRRALRAQFSDSHDDLIKEEIEDAIQEAFCRVLEQRSRRGGHPGLTNAPAYLLTAARNVCLDKWRRRARERSSVHHLLPGHTLGLAEHQAETLRWLAAYTGGLTGGLRLVYSARFIDGLSQMAAARVLGLTRRAVRTLERRLLVEVKLSLEAAQRLTEAPCNRVGTPVTELARPGVPAVPPEFAGGARGQRPKTGPQPSYAVTASSGFNDKTS